MLKKLILLLISCAIFSHAADGTWIDTTGGTRQWQDASNWQDGTVPSGYGSTASFFSAMPASVIYLPETAEVGSLDVVASGTATGFEFRDGLLTLDGSSPVVNASTRDFFCRTPLAGTNGFTKTGSRSFRPYRFSQMSGAITLHSGILGLDFRQAANSTNYLATNLMHPDGVLLGSSSPQIRIGGRPNAVQRSGAWVVTVGSKIATYVSGDNASTLSCGQKLSENTSFPTGTFLEVIYDNTTIGLSQSAVQSATESLTFESASFKTRQEFDLFDTGTGQGGSIYLNDVDDDTRIVLKELQGRKPLTVSGPGRVEIGVTGEFSSYVKLSDGNLTLADQRAMLDAPAVGAAFHVDASCTNTMVLIPYNDGYLVDRWNDKNSTPVLGQSYIRYAQSNTRGAFAPLLVENALNGLPVVDFGSPGSLMGAVWSEPLNGIKTVFWVVGSQNGGGMLLGSKDNAPLSFERGMDVFKCKDYAAKSYTTPLTMDHALFFTLSDDNRCWINGGEVDHQYSGLSGGFDLVSFVWGEDDVGGSASAFAMRQNMSSYPERSGGQRLAEVIVYQRELSEQERMDTEAYLSWKWFGRQMPGYGSPRIGNVVQESGSSSVVQESTEEMTIDHLSVVGDLSIQSCSNVSLPAADLNAGSLILNGGAVEISTRTVPSAIAEGHALHLDASDADSFTISAGKVTQWRDSSGGSHYAFNNFGSEAQPGIINGAQNGLPVVDFGVIGSGEHLCWDTNINVRSLFMVMSVKSSATTPLGSYVPMLSKGHFSRVNSGGMIWSPTVGDLSVHEGTAYLNGVACKPTHTELPNNQFVLVTENLQGTALACAFGGEAYNYLNAPLLRKERTGGLQLGEVIIYDRRVSDQERRDIEAYLYLKWFGEVMPGYALGTGSKLAESISVSNSARLNLIGNGSVFVDELVASSGLVVSNEGYFTANAYSGSGDFLKMGAGTLDLSTAAPLEGRITVEDGTLCITGSVDLLRVDQDGVVDLGGGSISTEFLGGSGVIDNGDCKVSYLRTDPSGSALNTLRCGGNLFFPEDAVYEVGVNTEHTVSCVDVAGELVVEGQGSILLPVWLKTLPAGHYKLFSFGSISEDSSRNLVNSWQVASALRPGLTEKIKVIDQGVYLYIAHTGTVVMVDGPAPVKDYDVVVVGGGSAGFGAAYSAALLGAKTALVEREHMLGGTSTICGVNNWEPGIGGTGVCYRIYQRMTQITNAIAVMSQDRHVSTYDPDVEPYRFPGGLYVPDPTMSYSDSLRRYGLSGTQFHNVAYEYQVMSDVMMDMLEDTGNCTLYLSNACVDVESTPGLLSRVRLSDGTVLRAKTFIDGTDGWLCGKTGEELMLWHESKDVFNEPSAPDNTASNLNGVTLMYRITPIAEGDPDQIDPLPAGVPSSCWWGGFPYGHMCQLPAGEITINMLPTMAGEDAWHLGWDAAYAECERRVYAHWHWLQSNYSEFRRFTLGKIYPRLAIRETVRVKGEYVLTQSDLTAGVSGQTHADIIAIADHPMDTHGIGASGGVEQPYGIPYRCLLPLKTKNLMIAGRAASFSALAASSCRLSRTMMQLGEAAGVAAYIATRDNISLREVDASEIRRLMHEHIDQNAGVYGD